MLLALLCVATAAIAVVLRVRGWINGTVQSGCGGGCNNCPASKDKPLVQIDFGKQLTKH